MSDETRNDAPLRLIVTQDDVDALRAILEHVEADVYLDDGGEGYSDDVSAKMDAVAALADKIAAHIAPKVYQIRGIEATGRPLTPSP